MAGWLRQHWRWVVPIAVAAPLLALLATGPAGGPAECGDLAGATVPPDAIGLPTSGAVVDTADVRPSTSTVAQHCEVQGRIAAVDPAAPDIRFRIALPDAWNGKAVHVGGGGYNGTVPEVTGNVPSAPPGTVPPLARGYAVFGSDSGHDGGNASFALNDEAMVNFGYAALKKTRDVAVEIMRLHHGAEPERTYFAGSSQGGREAVTVAQRFPDDYDGVLSRVPVLNFSGLQLAGNRVGTMVAAGGWIGPAQTALVHDAVMAACDGADGLEDGLIADYAGCEFDPTTLACPPGVAADGCLSEAQVALIRTIREPLRFAEPVANGVSAYPPWPTGHEAGWTQWVMGDAPPQPEQSPGVESGDGRIGNYGAQFVRYFLAQDPELPTRGFDHEAPRWRERIGYVSSVVDSTDPDLAAFHGSGGKLIVQEAMGDYGRSGYAGIGYVESVRAAMGGERADEFLRLYVAPGADHGGLGAPALVDWLTVLEDWVERGQAPGDLVAAQTGSISRAMPACRYPAWPRYVGGNKADAGSFRCTTD